MKNIKIIKHLNINQSDIKQLCGRRKITFDPDKINCWSDLWSAGITILEAAYGPTTVLLSKLHDRSTGRRLGVFAPYNGLTSDFFKWTDEHKEKLANASSAFLDLICRLLVSLFDTFLKIKC